MYNCISLIDKYKIIDVIDQGGYGVVFNVYNTISKEESALKILEYKKDLAEKEIKIGALLSNIPGFIKLKSWYLCNIDITNSLNKHGIDTNCPLLYIELEKAVNRLEYLFDELQPKLTSKDVKSMLFEILSGLYTARALYKFCHNDINQYNILYKINPEPRSYTLPNDIEVIASSIYQPVFIDFGKSEINVEVCDKDKQKIAGLTKTYFSKYSEISPNLINMIRNTKDYYDVIHSEFFDELYKAKI